MQYNDIFFEIIKKIRNKIRKKTLHAPFYSFEFFKKKRWNVPKCFALSPLPQGKEKSIQEGLQARDEEKRKPCQIKQAFLPAAEQKRLF